ncbi:MAG: autotransporter domain-containing protein [Propionivibrio sp.]|nr:autotransporter domain-containing protein [Propionivibrio sp.]
MSGNFGGAVVNNGTLVVDNGAAGNFVVLAGLTGTGSLIKNGGGTLNAIGPDWNYSGNTTLNAGIIDAPIISTGRLTVNGGIFRNNLLSSSSFGSPGSAGTTIDLNGGTLTVGGDNSSTTYSGTFSAIPGNLVKAGTGTLTLEGAPLHTGSTTINAGTLQVGNGGALAGSSSFGGPVVNNGTLAFDYTSAGGIATLGAVSGTGNLTKSGSGTLILTGAPGYTGSTTINAGTLQVGSGGALAGSSSFGGAVVNNGTLAFDYTSAGGNATLGAVSGTGSLTKSGSGTLIMTGAPGHTGPTTINAGTLQVGNGGALAGSSSFGGAVVNNGTLAFDYSSAGGSATLGAVSGAGSLVKNGSGTLILTGTPGHTGTTTINAGTLQVGTGGALSGSSSFGGAVLNNGTLVFDYSSAGGTSTLSNLSGNGNLIKNGSGLLNLTGTSTNTGSMQVNAGTLAVNGAIASAVNINAGGTLGGIGTINNAVTANAGGVIAPGNSIGTLTVNGSVAFNAGSIYRVEVNPAGNADRINVIGAPGTATIGGGTVDVQAGAGTYSPATIYTIINATGGVAGTFSSVTSNLAFLTPSLAYDPNNVFLTLTRNAATFPSVALTPNQIAVSNMLEPVANAGPTGDMGTVVNGLLGLSAPQARAAFDAIGGASIVELRRANVAFARVFTGDLDSRIQQPAGAGVAKSGEQPASPDGRGFWIKANASAYRTDGDGNAFENEVRGGSIAFGADAAPAKDVIVGLAAAYGKGNLDFDGIPDSGWTRNGALAVYGNYVTGPWAFKGIAGYAFGRNQLDRPIVFGPIARVAQGEFDSQSGTVYAEATYDIPMDGFSLRPLAGLSWVISRQQGFTESGAGALNLAVTGETTNSLRTLLGVKTVHALPTGNGGVVFLEPRLLWSHEFGDLNTPLDAQLTGAGAAGNFTVAGVNLKRDSAIAGLRVSGSVSKDIELFADILVSGNSSQTSASAFAGVRMAW